MWTTRRLLTTWKNGYEKYKKIMLFLKCWSVIRLTTTAGMLARCVITHLFLLPTFCCANFLLCRYFVCSSYRQVTTEMAEQLADKHHMDYFETSAITGTRTDAVFQDIFTQARCNQPSIWILYLIKLLSVYDARLLLRPQSLRPGCWKHTQSPWAVVTPKKRDKAWKENAY